MSAARVAIAVAWAVSVAAPLAWWLLARRRVDVWRALPVPAALLDADGAVRRCTGPDAEANLTVATPLPARGVRSHGCSVDGTPVALTGVRGGALALALPAEPAGGRRERLLGELAARTAHDIATPLAAVAGHLDLIAHEEVPDAVARSVRVCREQVARVSALATDLLALTAVRAGGATRRRVNAAVLAEEAVAALLGEADAAGAHLAVALPAEPVWVLAADGDLVRALRNLLRNALVHGLGSARRVSLAVAADADTVTFAVTDSGPGIAPERLAALAAPLVSEGGRGGSGLGLAIVSEVLAAHGSALVTVPERAQLSFTLPRVR